jgi:hypothetical protein
MRIEKVWDPETSSEKPSSEMMARLRELVKDRFIKAVFYNGTDSGLGYKFNPINDYKYYGAYVGDNPVGSLIVTREKLGTDMFGSDLGNKASFIMADNYTIYDSIVEYLKKEITKSSFLSAIRPRSTMPPRPIPWDELPYNQRMPQSYGSRYMVTPLSSIPPLILNAPAIPLTEQEFSLGKPPEKESNKEVTSVVFAKKLTGGTKRRRGNLKKKAKKVRKLTRKFR